MLYMFKTFVALLYGHASYIRNNLGDILRVKLIILNQILIRIINFNKHQPKLYLVNNDKGHSKFITIKKLRANEIQ